MMKRSAHGGTVRHLLLAALLVPLSAPLQAQDVSENENAPLPDYRIFGAPASDTDADAIARLMETFNQAWAAEDIDALLEVYAPDAEWTNTFGTVKRGHDELRAYFTELFDFFDASVGAEEASRGDPVSMRYLGSEVAVLHNVTESNRGASRGGEGARWVHITYVLHKQAGGWRITHQMIMDARR